MAVANIVFVVACDEGKIACCYMERQQFSAHHGAPRRSSAAQHITRVSIASGGMNYYMVCVRI